MVIRKYITLLLLVFSISGCNNDSSKSNEDNFEVNNDFEVNLETKDKFDQLLTSFAQGENITIILHIKNISSTTKNLNFNSSKQYDFVVKNSENELFWRWSSGQLFTDVLTSYDLAPNEERIITYTWNQMTSDTGTMLPVGSYVLETDDIGIDVVATQKLTIL
ncbi:MAG: BsuPI-related putative proteinase inhibitor [Candidatus Thiodiazotropha sp.]|jgi:uncharacterized lipoprotein NlpE involved in copper resistance